MNGIAEMQELHFAPLHPEQDAEAPHGLSDGSVLVKMQTLGCTCGFRLSRHHAVIALAELLKVLAPDSAIGAAAQAAVSTGTLGGLTPDGHCSLPPSA